MRHGSKLSLPPKELSPRLTMASTHSRTTRLFRKPWKFSKEKSNPSPADPMNLNKLMKQAQKMQEQMARTQAELENKTVEVSAGGGKVKVTANGAGDIVAIKIDKEVVDPNDIEFLEEIVLTAVKQAAEQGKSLAQEEMTKLTGGFQL